MSFTTPSSREAEEDITGKGRPPIRIEPPDEGPTNRPGIRIEPPPRETPTNRPTIRIDPPIRVPCDPIPSEPA
ncbi:MAG: hypothetical protein QOE77_3868 [Blastocatellia bacterium]|jgi:hypothetical protein|nr:hypothetical protein [Blastocatellia bacterium]